MKALIFYLVLKSLLWTFYVPVPPKLNAADAINENFTVLDEGVKLDPRGLFLPGPGVVCFDYPERKLSVCETP